jgi:hypothetical protein
MTDDSEWLHSQKLNISKEWRIYDLPIRKDARIHNSPNATENGVDFFASMTLARQCQAFVGK